MSPIIKLAILGSAIVYLNGCAVGRMLMTGYTPPPILGSLEGQEPGEETRNPDALAKSGNILLENYKRSDALPDSDVDYTPDMQPWQTPSTLFRPSFSHKSLQDYAGQLSMQLLQNSSGMKKDDLIGVASFVRLGRDLQQTNILGNQLAEYFISEIQQFGLAVVDFKMTGTAKVTRSGDFIFSRNSFDLAKDLHMDHMLSGTMIDKAKGVQINARIISVDNRKVVSSASVLIPHFIAQGLRPEYVSMRND